MALIDADLLIQQRQAWIGQMQRDVDFVHRFLHRQTRPHTQFSIIFIGDWRTKNRQQFIAIRRHIYFIDHAAIMGHDVLHSRIIRIEQRRDLRRIASELFNDDTKRCDVGK